MDINENEFTEAILDDMDNQQQKVQNNCGNDAEQNCDSVEGDISSGEEENAEELKLMKEMLMSAFETEIKEQGNLEKVSEKTLKAIESKISEKGLIANTKRLDAVYSFIDGVIHRSISGSERDIYAILSNVEQVIMSILVRYIISILNHKTKNN